MKQKILAFVVINATANLSRIRWDNRKVFGGSIADERSGDTDLDTYYDVIPYQYGLLRAYIEQYALCPGQYRFLEPCFRSASVEATARYCARADLVGYSVYIWNEQFNLAVARRVKELNPSAINCFGGPQVPADAEAFLRENPSVDIACFGEGEESFLHVAEHLDAREWSACAGAAWLDSSGIYHQNPYSFFSSKQLAACRSPYETGVFDSLLSKYPEVNWFMLMETNRGCPFKCAYCGWGSGHLERRVRSFSMERTRADLEWAGRHDIKQILICDSNFGLLPRDLEIVDHAIDVSERTGAFNAISVQSTCAMSERVYTIHEKLTAHHLSGGATVGVQSRSERVLDLCRRRFVPNDELDDILNRYALGGVSTYCDVILGLPGETLASFTSGIAELVECGQYNNLFVYTFTPLINTVMGSEDFQREHGLRIVRQEVCGTHTPVSENTAVAEYMDVVVETAMMPASDWCRAKAYLCLTHLLFFSRVLQVPMLLGMKILDLDFCKMVEAFLDADPAAYPVTGGLSRFCLDQARAVQLSGAPEMIPAEHLRDAWWPPEQYAVIQLVREGKLDAFYDEARSLLSGLLPDRASEKKRRFLTQSVSLNHALFRVPFVEGNVFFAVDFNLKALYRGLLKGQAPILLEGPQTYEIIRTRPEWKTWEGWYDHLMFCYNQKEYYLYGLRLCNETQE
ncbi:MAG: cobalamin-dependent protein [Deltaproteobacteria bacterium]|nr:cobalamin-dependent protein [Deltaproteobacteria bacterium]